ncbi:DUF3772 domain-containing protein [Paracoccus sp. (in: a-proteobacteria)]|uniref:DUF3772 domain-containing protein n=1 Tax=Paracoccus sp. TaxID=267 RepID=UPI0026DEEB28|nr:DUF3772 domain-containing protein [Paracoccus sp. (in: a-proteobacteria)]MDO5648433.1 DUF3772 domain-containing protein [Paracoccus sp. (in: a-proteobacteria)]
MMRSLIAVLLTVLALMSTPVLAQQSLGPNYPAWQLLADRAEAMVLDPDASSQDLARARARMVNWRADFQAAQTINSERITLLRNQLDALGPAPEDGTPEAEDVAARRAELTEQLATASAPRTTATEALSRANTIIAQIDEVIRTRQAFELARMVESPLMPSSWPDALTDGARLTAGVADELTSIDANRWQDLRPRMPRVLAFLFSAILLLTYGRQWVQSLPSRLSVQTSAHTRAVVAFIVSLGQIALPMLGVALAINAVRATGLSGPWTTPILQVLPVAGVILFSGLWLARQIFPADAVVYDTVKMAQKPRIAAGRMVKTLSGLLALHYILGRAVLPLSGLLERGTTTSDRVPMQFTETGAAVWHLVLIVLAALALFRLGTLMRKLDQGDVADTLYRHKALAWCGAISRLVAVVAVVITAFGLINLGNFILWPWLMTLALVGALILLQDFTSDVFGALQRDRDGARDGLAPLLIGLSLMLASVPLFMMIWGATIDELGEYWIRFLAGFNLGGVRLSPSAILTFLIIFSIGYTITRAVQGGLRGSILPKTRLDAGGQNAVVAGVGYIGIVVAALLAITSAGIDLSGIALVAGALSVGIGFGLQNIVSNFISGIILLIERPVSVGDWISAGGQQGIVKQISVRSTRVETFDRTEVIVPNSDLISQPVTNWTRGNTMGRIIIPVGVAYGSDTRRVQDILLSIIADHPLVTIDPPPFVLLRSFGADSINFEVRAILSDIGSGMGVTSEVLHQIAERFTAEGIELPHPQRDLWIRNPEDLAMASHAIDNPQAKDILKDLGETRSKQWVQPAQRELPDDD